MVGFFDGPYTALLCTVLVKSHNATMCCYWVQVMLSDEYSGNNNDSDVTQLH